MLAEPSLEPPPGYALPGVELPLPSHSSLPVVVASQKNHTASDVTEPRSFGPLTEEDSSQFASRHGFAMPCPPRRTDCARMSLPSRLHLCSVIAGISTLDMAFSSTPKNLDYLAEFSRK